MEVVKMDIISTAIVSLIVVVLYDVVLKKWILPLVQKWFGTTPPTQG
jgi:hypothetical protein